MNAQTSEHQRQCAPLLALLAKLLQCFADSAPLPAADARMCQLQLDGLARSILQRRLKALYSHLSSGVRARANGALALLAAVVGRSRALCAEVLAAFDFSLASLPKLAAGPKGSQVWLAPTAAG
jgi:hypothetical protein